MKKLTLTFAATDAAGKNYDIRVFTIYTAGRGQSWVDSGMKELETADGQPVLPIGKGEYQLKRVGTVIWSNDPSAP